MKKIQFNYQWVVVGLCILIVLTGTGFTGNRSMYISPICEAYGIKRSVFSISDSIRFLATAVMNLFFGYLVSKFGTKKLICTGLFLCTASFTLYSFADRVYLFYIAALLMGVSCTFIGTTMIGSVINKWCIEKTATITGLVMAFSGVGSAIMAPIITNLVMNSTFGFKTAYRLVATSLATAFIIVMLVYRDKAKKPSDMVAKKRKIRSGAWEGLSYSETSKKLYFIPSLVCIFLTGFCVQGFVSVTGAHMRDVGLDKDFISWVLTMHAVIFIFCKFGAGLMYDKFGLRFTSSLFTFAAVVNLVLMGFYTDSFAGRILVVISQIVSAFAIPLETVMLSIYAGDLFGQKAFDKIMGIFVAFNVFGYAVGVPVVNIWFDIFGSYDGILFINSGVMAAVLVAWQFIITSAHKVKKEITERNIQEVME